MLTFQLKYVIIILLQKKGLVYMNNILKSNRKHDMTQEKIINRFLLEKFFLKINKSSKLIDDRNLQIAGVDLQLDSNKLLKTLNIDIKAQSSAKYINSPRPTFLLELSSINKYGEDFIGWFLNPKIITDYYAFVWMHEVDTNDPTELFGYPQIKKVEIMLVSREKIKEYVLGLLHKNGYDDVSPIVNQMRDTETTRIPLVDGIHFSHTPTLYEKPVNLVVHKRILKKFASLHYYVYQDKIVKI